MEDIISLKNSIQQKQVMNFKVWTVETIPRYKACKQMMFV